MAPTRNAVHIGQEPLLGVLKEGKELSDFGYLEEAAEATLDELVWWTRTPNAGRHEGVRAAEEKTGEVLARRHG